MKRELKWVLIFDTLLLLLLLHRFADLRVLVDDNPRRAKILEPELRAVTYSNVTGELTPDRPLLIPKIIHQTYKTADVPEKWDKVRSTCTLYHPDYEYMFWTDDSGRDFIEAHYPWFMKTYDGYTYSIQRVDALRYFLLAHYGGVYVDLDAGCAQKIDPVLAFPAFLRKTEPIGISNDVMGSVPGHPFFLYVIENLENFDKHWLIKYLTVMYSTGPLFLSVMWKKFLKLDSRPEWGEVRVLFPRDARLGTTKLFFDTPGSSWHGADAKILLFIGDHILLTIIAGVLLFLFAFWLQILTYRRLAQVSRRHGLHWNIFRLFGKREGRHYTSLQPSSTEMTHTHIDNSFV